MVDKAKTKKILNQFTPVRANLCSTNGVPFELPNHSRGKAPESNSGLANKKYVDDLITSSTYWTANGNDIYNSNSGNVGIGTASPAGKLHIVDPDFSNQMIMERSGRTSDLLWASTKLLATKTTNMGDGFGVAFFFNIQDDAGVINSIGSVGASRDGADNSGKLEFQTVTAGADPTTKMTILNGGNVGIGTTSPAELLHIDDTDGGMIKLTRTAGASSGELGALQFGNVDVDNYLASIRSFQDGATDAARIAFYTEATGSVLSEKMRITSTGNVGIGTTSPSQKLHVVGTTYSQGDFIIKGVSSQKFVTFADGDTTPTVAGGNNFKTANTGATTITTFDNGVEGQIIKIIITDANTDFTNGASLRLYRAGNWTTAAANDTLTLIHDGSGWIELSRSDNS